MGLTRCRTGQIIRVVSYACFILQDVCKIVVTYCRILKERVRLLSENSDHVSAINMVSTGKEKCPSQD